jgi:succinyl-diaminopimelate desuccinylase
MAIGPDSLNGRYFLETSLDAVGLTRKLVEFDTINPPGNEGICAAFLGSLLAEAGFSVEYYDFAPGRSSVVARVGNPAGARTLCYIGHIDTVPLGKAKWTRDPFGGEIVGDRLYGRGASDMKASVAAFVVAAIRKKSALPPDGGLILVLAAGEETGCEGSLHLASLGISFGQLAGVIVGEPTNNAPLVGHKGALWLTATIKGVAAHGSTPQFGVNAVRKGAEVVSRLDGFASDRSPHAVLGAPTINVGTFHGGQNINSVPDWAEVGIDIRTTPGMDHQETRRELEQLLHPHVHELAVQASMGHVWTDPEHPWVQEVFTVVEEIVGERPGEGGANYFSDASALQEAINGAPTLILGPGDPAMAHQTDEYCAVSRIVQAVEIYEEIMMRTWVSNCATVA